MSRLAPAMLLCLAAFVRGADADTYPRQSGVDALHYVFRLELGDDSDEIVGDATVRVRFTTAGVNEVVLDLASLKAGKGMTVSQVLAGGAPVRFTHEDNRLRVASSAPPADGEAAFTIRYRGVPADGLRFLANIHGDRTMFSENWPNHARQWLPMIDHPYDKATGELIVTAPARYQVVSNGLLVEQLDLGDGRRRTHWKQAVPIASWLYALGVARFAVHHAGSVRGIPLETWAFPQDHEKAYALFEPTARRAIEFFDERIGRYSYEKLANVQAAGVSGATEHATAIFYSEKALEETIVVHEVAHQWWGNAVTERDWDDVWLSEGFATYFTLLYTEHVDGRDAFVAGLENSRARILQIEKKMPDAPVIHRNLADMRRVLNQLVYQKGGWVLHMVRGIVGTDVFWNGIREYYRRYRDRNASTDDFRHVIEESSGKDLAWFFSQWLTRSGVPRLEGSWQYDAARQQVAVSLAQSQPGEVYRLPVEIGIVAEPGARPRVERIELRDRSATFSFALDREPASVVLDPGTWLLMEAGPFARKP